MRHSAREFDYSIETMGIIGAATCVVVYSTKTPPTPDDILYLHEDKIPQGAYIQVISTGHIYELSYTLMEYPSNPKILSMDIDASRLLGSIKHDKIDVWH